MSTLLTVTIDAAVFANFLRMQRACMAAPGDDCLDAIDNYNDAATALGCEIQKSLPSAYLARFLEMHGADALADTARLQAMLCGQDVAAEEE